MLAAVGVGIIELAEAIGIGAGAAETVAGTAAGVELTTGAAGAAAGAAEGGAAGAAALESAPLIFSEGLDVAPGIYGGLSE